MLDKVYKDKAGMVELNNLHALVANHLADNLDDTKVLTAAIGFLKNNNISADIIESTEMVSLTDSIKAIANSDNKKIKELTVEDMLAV